ncbi:MAG: AAA family ATPase [Candidatus Riflebacteria bacterium]|nr:AAA family ATPase [Candidatus Riflebacteria bacterium]
MSEENPKIPLKPRILGQKPSLENQNVNQNPGLNPNSDQTSGSNCSPTLAPNLGANPATNSQLSRNSNPNQQGNSSTSGSNSSKQNECNANSSFFTELDILIRAKYPILYIVSHEEERVEKLIYQISQAQNKHCYGWSITKGLQPTGAEAQSRKKISESTRDPQEAIESIFDSMENAIYIFKDYHPFLDNISVIRRLRELAGFLRDSPRTLVIISPTLKIPCELEKEITVVEFGLPTSNEITRKLEEMIELVKSNPQVKINLTSQDKERLVKACQGLTLNEIENVLARTLISRHKLDGEDLRAIHSEKEQIIRKSGILEYYPTNEGIHSVGGLENLKDWFMKRSQAFSEKAKMFGCTPPKGILLLGVQGCGKSLVAKAISSLWNVPLLRLDMGRIFSGLVGSSEENVRRAIRTAESVSPAILWVDEIEKAFSGTQSSGQSDGGTASRVFGTFITWLQEKTSPVFVIATSNRIRDLPPELFRKGRFDDIFFVDLPDEMEREKIFEIHIKKRNRNPKGFDLALLSQSAEGFSGAEIEEAISSALYEAFNLSQELTTELIKGSLFETFPLSKTMKEEIDQLRSWAMERARPASRDQEGFVRAGTRRALEI